MTFQRLKFECVEGWRVLEAHSSVSSGNENTGIDAMTTMPPQDVRQYLYVLVPASEERERFVVAPSPGSIIPLGRLDISWTTSFGEPGRLLTSVSVLTALELNYGLQTLKHAGADALSTNPLASHLPPGSCSDWNSATSPTALGSASRAITWFRTSSVPAHRWAGFPQPSIFSFAFQGPKCGRQAAVAFHKLRNVSSCAAVPTSSFASPGTGPTGFAIHTAHARAWVD